MKIDFNFKHNPCPMEGSWQFYIIYIFKMLIYLIYRAKFEAMLFALCKDEDSDTASMRFFLNVSFGIYDFENNGLKLLF